MHNSKVIRPSVHASDDKTVIQLFQPELSLEVLHLNVETNDVTMTAMTIVMFADPVRKQTGSTLSIPRHLRASAFRHLQHSQLSFLQSFQALSEHLRRLTLSRITYGMSGTAVRRVQKVISRHHFAHSRRAADIPNTVCMATTGIRRHSQVAQQAHQGRGR